MSISLQESQNICKARVSNENCRGINFKKQKIEKIANFVFILLKNSYLCDKMFGSLGERAASMDEIIKLKITSKLM